MKLGKFLAIKRKQSGHSQKTLAEALGYSSGQFCSNWERDLALPPKDKIKKLCELTKIDPNELRKKLVQGYEARVKKSLRLK